jgi:hypothetical protein
MSLKRSVARVLRRFLRASTSRSKLENLKPNDVLVVYHGTGLQYAYPLLNGFDANTVRSRLYGGPRHKGLFITPKLSTAEQFSHRGELILEIMVRAKNLHGVDYSGNIGRKTLPPDIVQMFKEDYPNSFRPYLTKTMTQQVEPQGLLRGLVKPGQILRVRYKAYGEDPVWYSRKEFLNLGLETDPDGNYRGPLKPVKDFGIDLSYPGYSVEEIVDHLATLTGRPRERILLTLERRVPRFDEENLVEFLQLFGFGITAATAMAKRLRAHYLGGDNARTARSYHTMPDRKLRSAIIRLAYQRPEFREDLLPLVTASKRAAMSTDARELELYIENDGNLYRQQYQPIINNLMRKWRKGQYDFTKSIKLFGYLVDAGAKKYHAEFGTPGLPWHKAFPKSVRLEVAKSLAESFKEEAEAGGYD